MTKGHADKTKVLLIRELEEPYHQATDLKASERKARQVEDSELRYRRLFETAQDGILILDAKTGQITDVNPFLIDMLGYPREGLLDRKLWEISPFKDVKASEDGFRELQRKGYIRYEHLPLETKDGKQIWVEFISNVYRINGEVVIQCNIRDITARKRAEEESRKYKDQLELLVEQRTAKLEEANRKLRQDITMRERAEQALHASAEALAASEKVVSIGGGLHHAKPAYGEGFCLYNDVAFLNQLASHLSLTNNQSRCLFKLSWFTNRSIISTVKPRKLTGVVQAQVERSIAISGKINIFFLAN